MRAKGRAAGRPDDYPCGVALLDSANITSPKRRPGEKGDWYGYYAGYSAAFVRDTLATLVKSGSSNTIRVLDPWNGSGTTTAVAAAQGYETIGLDRNPALVTIAKARHLSLSSVKESLEPLLAEVITIAKSLTRKVRDNADNEELSLWFGDTSAARLRATERAIHRVLVDDDTSEILVEPVDPVSLSPLASFFYCILFTGVRHFTAPFRTSNPTWIRSAKTESERLEVEWPVIEAHLVQAMNDLADRLIDSMPDTPPPFHLYEGSVEKLKLNRKADIVVSSPPYCTRIDYVVATKPELVVLGNDAADIDHLRRQMLGTPLTEKDGLEVKKEWGSTATKFIDAATAHDSKAAGTYYRNYYLAYLRDLYKSLGSIDNATKQRGVIGLVVQDSYFKDIHFDLPTILTEMGRSIGRSSERLDFYVGRTKAAIHPGARVYRQTFSATESLIVLGKKGA
jgi:hypothetical protein